MTIYQACLSGGEAWGWVNVQHLHPHTYTCLFTFNADQIIEPHDVLNELSTVSQWYLLGLYLGLRPSTLDLINADYKTTRECRTQMLIEWQKHVIPTWSAVVKALMGIGREGLASHLAAKYGMCFKLTYQILFTFVTLKSSLFLQEPPFQTLLTISHWRNSI